MELSGLKKIINSVDGVTDCRFICQGLNREKQCAMKKKGGNLIFKEPKKPSKYLIPQGP
jgi:hypothetical protein